MVNVGRDNHPPGSHFFPHEFRRKIFPSGDELHLRGDLTLASIMDLGTDRVTETRLRPLVAIHAYDYRRTPAWLLLHSAQGAKN